MGGYYQFIELIDAFGFRLARSLLVWSVFSVAWTIAAVIFIFAKKDQFVLSLGVSAVWALLIYVARIE
jgi:hypothetical protein